MLNPEPTHEMVSRGGTTYKVRDKVMQIRNNYDKHVYNGDIGVVVQVNTTDKEMIVSYGDSKQVSYDFEELNELVFAYAISIHKSQGSEYRCVIVPVFLLTLCFYSAILSIPLLRALKANATLLVNPKPWLLHCATPRALNALRS